MFMVEIVSFFFVLFDKSKICKFSRKKGLFLCCQVISIFYYIYFLSYANSKVVHVTIVTVKYTSDINYKKILANGMPSEPDFSSFSF